jgi:SAM-dependent methyltransferase
MLAPEVIDYYRRGGERQRLAAGVGRLSFSGPTTLSRVLPPAPATVLDVSGATGVYASPLADAGYAVTVVDPLPEHVAEAATRPGVDAVQGDVRALPVDDASAGAVLLLGPLYHLLDRADRVLAWRQAGRVVCPGGVVVAATINRFASLFDGFVKDYFSAAGFLDLVKGALADGVHRNPDGAPRTWFTSAYFHMPTEAADEARDGGLVVERVVALESPLWMNVDRLEAVLADDRLVGLLIDMLRRVEEEPSLLGASSHVLTVARRSQA